MLRDRWDLILHYHNRQESREILDIAWDHCNCDQLKYLDAWGTGSWISLLSVSIIKERIILGEGNTLIITHSSIIRIISKFIFYLPPIVEWRTFLQLNLIEDPSPVRRLPFVSVPQLIAEHCQQLQLQKSWILKIIRYKVIDDLTIPICEICHGLMW